MNTDDIMESLKMDTIWRSNQPLPTSLISAIEEGLSERDQINETYQNVMAEKCAPDEHHCSCVPFLRQGIRELQANIRQYENRIAAKDEVISILRADIQDRAADAKAEREANQ